MLKVMLVAAVTSTALAAPAATAGTKQESERAIRAALERWVEDVNAGRLVKSNDIWASDIVGWYPGQPDFTYEQVQKAIAKGDPPPPAAGAKRRAQMRLHVDEVIVQGPLAIVRDTWGRCKLDPSSGKWNLGDVLRGFEVWRRGQDGWKIARWISAPEDKPAASITAVLPLCP